MGGGAKVKRSFLRERGLALFSRTDIFLVDACKVIIFSFVE